MENQYDRFGRVPLQGRDPVEEERLWLAMDMTSDGLYDYDFQTGSMYLSPRCYTLLGYEPNEWPACWENFSNLIHPEDKSRAYAELRGYNRCEASSHEVEMRLRTKSGGWQWVLSRGRVIFRDAEGRPKRLVGRHVDIHARKEAEASLNESRERYRLLFSQMSNGFVLHEMICDPQGRPIDFLYLEVNAAFQRITGWQPEDVIGRTLRQTIPQIDEGWFEKYVRVASTGEPLRFEVLWKDPDRFYDITAFSPQPGEVAVLFADVTKQKQLEGRLYQAQKLEAIGNLAGGIAHDFNNILAGILMHSELLMDELSEGSPARESTEKVLQATLRARDLIRQIMVFSRKVEPERKPVTMQSLLADTLHLLRAALPASIEIKSTIAAGNDVVMTNSTEIQQMLLELATNSAYAMQENGGIIELFMQPLQVSAAMTTAIPDLRPGDYVLLGIRDTGCGMSPDIQDRIFDPFFTTKPVGEGTGLGLAEVHGIVKGHGGAINIHSEVGKGTEVLVYLPQNDFRCLENSPSVSPPVGGRQILLADDEDFVLKMLARMLESLGYQVTKAHDGEEALAAFAAAPKDYDLVISDLAMPAITGTELSLQISRLRPGLPIILCTGFGECVSEEERQSLGISAILSKPILKDELVRVIRRVGLN